mmetsp:Transcript_57719/g.160883  ORF Transcript_57719/g.160883 Transcript_57719/m.160883 type:complete len:146 (+) Transcript_57719:69-506(+)
MVRMCRSFPLLLAAIFSRISHTLDYPCSELDEYAKWAVSWTETCRAGPARWRDDPNATGPMDIWFRSCDWITCECLWGLAETPVPTDEIAPCFREALSRSLLAEEPKLMMTALLRTCRSRTNEYAHPCGKCDRYAELRGCNSATV